MPNAFSLLGLLAELSIALLGFIAVFSVFSRRDGKFSAADKHFIQAMVLDSVTVTGFAITAHFLRLAIHPEQLWFVCATGFVIVGTFVVIFIAVDQAQMPKDESQTIHVLWHIGAWSWALVAAVCVFASLFEAVSKLFEVVLRPKIGGGKAPCAGNSGSISKRGNAASADFRPQPPGPAPFFRSSALFSAH